MPKHIHIRCSDEIEYPANLKRGQHYVPNVRNERPMARVFCGRRVALKFTVDRTEPVDSRMIDFETFDELPVCPKCCVGLVIAESQTQAR